MFFIAATFFPVASTLNVSNKEILNNEIDEILNNLNLKDKSGQYRNKFSEEFNENEDYIPGQLLVQFYKNTSISEIDSTIIDFGTEIINSSVQMELGDYVKVYWLKIIDEQTVWEKIHRFEDESSIVEYAEPNFYTELEQHQLYADDPWFPNQWGLLNAGQKSVATGLAELSVVLGADTDIGLNLIAFNNNERHSESIPANGDFDKGEAIYQDNDNDNTVSIGDTRLIHIEGRVNRVWITYRAGSIVAAGERDINRILLAFKANEIHDETVNANGKYDYGEGIYRDNDASGTVTTGDTRLLIISGGVIDADTDMPQAWSLINQYDLWRNGNPQVAIIDTGVDSTHPDLAPNLLGPMIHDTNGHGTHVAGIIGAVGNNGQYTTGVNWHAQMRVFQGMDLANFTLNMLTILLLKLMGENIKVISYSGHFIAYGSEHYSFVAEQLIALAGAHDILFVTSAGNGAFDNDIGEYIYRDNDGSGTISVGDSRLTEITAFHQGPAHPLLKDATQTYAAGSAVAAGNWDAIVAPSTPTPLVNFLADELYVDSNGNTFYDSGEPIYWDRDNDGFISRGDLRLTSNAGMPACSVVRVLLFGLLPDPDVTIPPTPLTRFKNNERHVDNKHIDGRPQDARANQVYDGPAHYPSNYQCENIIAVAASNTFNHIADFSNYGKTSVDLAAPGEDIISLAPLRDINNNSLPGSTGVEIMSGTSMATPHVSGVASLAFAMFPWKTALEVKNDILFGALGPVPASGVDRKASFGSPPNSDPILVSDGRLRWPYTGDLGDAPDSYNTIAATSYGALHWDNGNEWFSAQDNGIDFDLSATNEVDADWFPPYDQDPTANILPFPGLDIHDHPTPQNFWFFPPLPWIPGQVVTVYYYIATNYLGVDDAEGGRYQSLPNRMIYVNGYFDWNWNGLFDIPGEHSVHQPHDLSLVAAPGTLPAVSPPTTWILRGSSNFIALNPTPRWIRFRLDYGEDVGAVNPDPPIPPPTTPAPVNGLPGFRPDRIAPIWEHTDRAIFGEVEDWRPNGKKKLDPPTEYIWQYWELSDEGVDAVFTYSGTEPLIIKPSYTSVYEYIPLCSLTWAETQELEWMTLDETIIYPDEEIRFNLPIGVFSSAAAIRYSVTYLDKPEEKIARFLNEVIFRMEYFTDYPVQYIDRALISFDLYNYHDIPVNNYELELYGDVAPCDIFGWYDPYGDPYMADGIYYGGWGSPSMYNYIDGGIEIEWIDDYTPIQYGDGVHFGLEIDPFMPIPTYVKGYWTILNSAPYLPSTPEGPSSGKPGKQLTYTTNTTDPEGNQVYYWFDWGDGTDSGWIGPYNSGTHVSASHVWNEKGDYSIKVKTKDTYGYETGWSEPLAVSMPKNRAINTPFFNFLQNHPILYHLLQRLLKL
jgi:subtilisin family serine protease